MRAIGHALIRLEMELDTANTRREVIEILQLFELQGGLRPLPPRAREYLFDVFGARIAELPEEDEL